MNSPFKRIEADMLAPSKKYIARAVPWETGYAAQFSAPGLIPELVGDQDDPLIFQTVEEAENSARRALFGILSKPRETQSRGRTARYQKLSGADFAILLAESGLSLTLFAHLYGSNPNRVQSWIDGTDNAPHPARILLEIFKAYPETIDLAETITDSTTSGS